MLKNLNKIINLAILCAVFSLTQIMSVPAQANSNLALQEPIPPGIDLIVLLDQSGSMKGIGGQPTDPENRRIYTTQYLMDYLSFDNRFVNPDRSNRVMVIGFGSPDKAEIMVPLTYLKDEDAVDNAKKLVVAKDLGDTNFVSPLRLLREVFPPATDEEVKTGARQRIVVVITDGGPWDDRGLTHNEYFNEIRDVYINQLGLSTYFPLYIVGIDDANRYWPRIGPLWQTFTKASEKVNNVNEINKYVADKLCNILNPEGSQSECRLQDIGNHFIQPYASSVAFSFFKYSPNAQITLKRPGENTAIDVKPPDDDVLVYKQTPRDEFYALSNPKAGCWESARKGEGSVDVVTQVVFNKLRLVEPKGLHPVALPLKLTFELRDEEGSLIDEDPNYPVTIQAELIAPDGSSQPMTIERARENGVAIPGKYVSTNIPDLKQTGRYRLAIEGYTSVNDPQATRCLSAVGPVKVFQNEYEISVGQPKFQLVSPSNPWLQYAPLTKLMVGFSDDQGNLFKVPDGAPWGLELTAKSPSGQLTSLPTPQLAGGIYNIDQPVVLSETGDYKLEGVLKNQAGEVVYRGTTDLELVVNPVIISPGKDFPASSSLKQVRIALQDLDGGAVTPNPQYPLRLEAELFSPNKQDSIGLVNLKETNVPGEYTGDVDWLFSEVGAYTMNVRGYLKIGADNELLAFDKPIAIGSSDSLPYFMVVTPEQNKPGNDNIYALHRGLLPIIKPMPLKVEVLRNGQHITPGDVFTDIKGLGTVDISDANGQPLVVDRELVLSKDGQFLETIAPELEKEGAYSADFRFKGNISGGISSEGAWPDVHTEFERHDPDWVLWAWRLILTAVVIVSVGFLAWYLLEFQLLMKAKGKLVAEVAVGTQRGEKIGEFLINRKNRHTVVYRKKQSPMGRLKLSKLTVTPADDPLKSFDWRIYLPIALLSALITLMAAILFKGLGWKWIWVLLGINLLLWVFVLFFLKRSSQARQTRARDPRAQRGEQRVGVLVEANGRDRKGVAKGSLFTTGGNRYLNVSQEDANNQKYQFKLEDN